MRSRVRHGVHVVLVSLLLTVFVSLLGGMVFEAIGSALDGRRFPQVGTSYVVGGRKFNLYCTGVGNSTVILESGLGVPGYGWYKVQPEVARFARVCSYDRAGYGWSDRPTTRRTSHVIAQELHALLGAAGLKPPYVLVGHSFGGFTIRVFNGLYPDEVAGLVFVDSSHEDQESRMNAETRGQMARATSLARFIPPAINIGLLRVVRTFRDLPLVPPSVSGEARGYLEYLTLQPKLVRAAREEMELFGESAGQVRESGTAGDKPLIVLTAGKPAGNDEVFYRAWVDELQPAIARLSTRGKRVMLPESGHMIPYEQPAAVVEAVREVSRSH